MKIYDFDQQSDEWFNIRIGKFGASKAAELLMSPSTNGYNNLINLKVYQKLTGETPNDLYQNDWMERGTELESEARQTFEYLTFTKVSQIGYIERDEWTGCSPDGLINPDGLLQIKCPKYSVHIDYLLSNKIPDNYYKQCQYELMITERKYNIFFSYHPKLKPFIFKIQRDENLIKNIEIKLKHAIQDVKSRIAILKGI